MKLTQKQFFIGEGKEVGRKWEIPLNANFKAPKIMSDVELDLGDYQALRAEAGHALRLNVGNNSHFIVKYDQTLMDDIMKEARTWISFPITIAARPAAFGRRQAISYADVVPVLELFKNSESHIVNDALCDCC